VAFNREKALTAAAKFASKGQHDRAAKEYVSIIEADPSDVRSWLLLAEALVNAGDKAGALERYLHVGKHYTEAGDAQKAIAVYRKVLGLDPNRLDIQTAIAGLYKDMGRTADSVAAYEFVAQAYFQAGQIAEGLEGFRMVAELEPAAVGKRLRLAELYSREGMVPQAVEHFRLAAERLLADRRTDDYIRVAERLIYHKEDDLPVLRSLAQIYLKQGENRRALVKLNALLRAAPADAEGLELLGETFVAIGKIDKAISVVMELAREQRKGGRKAKETAARVLRKALGWNPENAEDIKKTAGEIEAEIAALPPEPKDAREARDEDIHLDVDVVEDEAGPAGSDLDLDVDIEEDERKVEEVPSRPFAPVDANVASSVVEAGEDSVGDVEKVLLEARVYVKYKMFEHALGHLDTVFVREASHVPALELQAQILIELARHADAADTFVRLAQLASGRDAKLAREHIVRAQALVPDHTKAEMVLAALDSGDGGSAEPAPLIRGLQGSLSGDPETEARTFDPGQSSSRNTVVEPDAVASTDSTLGQVASAEPPANDAGIASVTPDVPTTLAAPVAPEANKPEPERAPGATADETSSANKPVSEVSGARPLRRESSRPLARGDGSGARRLPTEVTTESSGTRRLPTEVITESSGARRLPTEVITESSGARRLPTEVITESSGARRLPTEATTESSGARRLPTEATTESSGARRLPTEATTESSGARRLPTEATTESSGARRLPTEATTESSGARRLPTEAITESSGARRLPTEATTESSGARRLPTEATPISALRGRLGEKTQPSRFSEKTPLPTFRPPPSSETISKAGEVESGDQKPLPVFKPPATPSPEPPIASAAEQRDEPAQPVTDEAAANSRARSVPAKPTRGPTGTAFKPPTRPAPQPSAEVEELDAEVEELDVDEVAEVVEAAPTPSLKKGPPSRPKPPTRRPPGAKPGPTKAAAPIPEVSAAPQADESRPVALAVEGAAAALVADKPTTPDAIVEATRPEVTAEASPSAAMTEATDVTVEASTQPAEATQPEVPTDAPTAITGVTVEATRPEVPTDAPALADATGVTVEATRPEVTMDATDVTVAPTQPEVTADAAALTDAPAQSEVIEAAATAATPAESEVVVAEASAVTAATLAESEVIVAEASAVTAATPAESEVIVAEASAVTAATPAESEVIAESPVAPALVAEALTAEPAEASAVTAATPAESEVIAESPVAPALVAEALTAEPASVAPAEASWPDITDEVEELRFFISGRFEDDAQFAYLELQRRFPGHPELAEFSERFTAGARIESAAAPVTLEDAAPATTPALTGAAPTAFPLEDEDEDSFLASIFDEPAAARAGGKAAPRRAVATLDDGADAQTFFDLGTAYREMGLLDDALTQFDLAARDARWTSRARVMMASLRVQRGENEQALTDLQTAIDSATDQDEQSEARYELGVLYQALGDTERAIAALKVVAAGYRDRDERLASLGA
jgi:tetratricopeptide (TPR) repeat protein